jgi:tRNA(Ile)-lysidine synthase TilS/MesJ
MTHRQCSNCVLDTHDDPTLEFDERGVCNHCNHYFEHTSKSILPPEVAENELKVTLDRIKEQGKGKPYDCVVGVSGGVDSTYVAYLAKKWGLRPLVVHLDNAWNSELAVKNIESIVSKLGFDLFTYVIDWEEFKDLQLSYFKANVIDIEVLSDHAITACLYDQAKKHGIKTIFSGNNAATEGILPGVWVHRKLDWLNIEAIHKTYGTVPLKTFPKHTYWDAMMHKFVYKTNIFYPLNYIHYNKAEVKQFIIKELGWRDYGGKHYESVFTRFYQSHILPEKFGVDKRKAHLATLICSGQMTKAEALEELKEPIINADLLKQDKEYTLKKLGFTPESFEAYLHTPPVPHMAFPSYENHHWKRSMAFFSTLSKIKRMLLGRGSKAQAA